MNKKLQSMLNLIFVFMFCILITNCSKKETDNVIYNQLTRTTELKIPANFIIKLTGKTNYSLNDKEIPVAAILKEGIETNINNIENFSIDASDKANYIIGIDIVEYNPKLSGMNEMRDMAKEKLRTKLKTQFKLFTDEEDANVSNIVCDVGIYTVNKDKSGEQVIGDKLLLFTESYVAGEQLDDYNVIDLKQIVTHLMPSEAAIAAELAVEGVDTAATIGAEEAIVKGVAYKITKTIERIFKGKTKS